MLRTINAGALRDRLQGIAATALGLAFIALVFVFLVPRQGEIAASMDEARRARAAQAATAQAEADARSAASTRSPPVTPATEEPAELKPSAPQTAAIRPSDAPRQEAQATLLARPVALDTGTILIRRGKVRLVGVAPVALARKCGEGRASWFCGVEARTQFRNWLRARSISCDVPAGFGQATVELASTCNLGGEDIGRWLVTNGWAEAAADGPYRDAETRAKTAKLGVWADRRPGT